MKHQFENVLEKYEISLEDTHPNFQKSVIEFLDFTKSDGATPEQIDSMDKELVNIFYKNHDIEEFPEGTDPAIVEAKKNTAQLMAQVDNYKAKCDLLEKQNAEKDDKLKKFEAEQAEREQKIAEKRERERIAKENFDKRKLEQAQSKENEKNESLKQKLDALVQKEVVSFDELESYGIENIGASKIEWNGLLFQRTGVLMSRRYAVFDNRQN